jgi:putative oxygen-independent coproporphyrinogen III oxidase
VTVAATEPPARTAPPLGLYIHWPYCARICPYCDFAVVRDRGRAGEQAELLAAIAHDLERQAALTGPRELRSIYFGGGTPSLMPPEAAAALIARACRLWTPAADLEVTLEANPTDAEAARFAAFAAAGVERLSLGVQALDDAELAFLGRNHDAAAGVRAVEAAVRAFPRVSLDLIYALPGQDAPAWAATLRRAAALGAEHVSPYQLTIEPSTPFARAVDRGRFAPADPDLAADLYETTQDVLEELGFDAYEVSNHARGAEARARHNLVYWRGHDYVGAGPGAHGRLTLGGARHATAAPRRIADYLAAARAPAAALEPLTPVEAAEERVLMGLRLDEGVAMAELAPLGLTSESRRIRDLVDDGFLTAGAGRLRATPAGRRVLDAVTRTLILGR